MPQFKFDESDEVLEGAALFRASVQEPPELWGCGGDLESLRP